MSTMTGPLPLLPQQRRAINWTTPTAYSRSMALDYLGADGTRIDADWKHFDVIVGQGGLWIAQDDYLPEDPYGDDPVAAEWRQVVRYLWGLGYDELGDPMFDTKTQVWVWVVLT